MLNYYCLILSVFYLGFCGFRGVEAQASAKECNVTVLDLLNNSTNLSYSATWAKNAGYAPVLGAPIVNITLLVPTNSEMAARLPEYTGVPFNITDPASTLATVALYNTLEGQYSEQDLLAAGSINSLLGMLKDVDLPLKFYNDSSGNMTVMGLGGGPSDVAHILQAQRACNGWLYTLDRLLLPANYSSQISRNSGDSILASKIFLNGTSCGSEIPTTLEQRGQALYVAQAIQAPGLSKALANISNTFTILVPNRFATGFMLQDAPLPEALYNILPGAYCPSELVGAGPKNTMLGELLDADLPITFTQKPDGGVVVSGAEGSANIMYTTLVCDSVVLVTDGPLAPPGGAVSSWGGASLPRELPTVPRRHLTCKPVTYNNTGIDGSSSADGSSSGSGGTNTSLIVGLVVGLGGAVVLASGFAWWKMRRHGQETSPDGKLGGSKGSSLEQSTPLAASGSGGSSGIGIGNATPAESGSSVTSPGSGTGSAPLGMTIAITRMPSIPLGSGSISPLAPGGNRSHNKLAGLSFGNIPLSAVVDSDGAAPPSELKTNSAKTVAGGAALPTSLGTWEVQAEDLSIDADAAGAPIMLGRGSFGNVYMGLLRGVQPVAVKVLPNAGSSAARAFLQEADILQRINRDRNIVQLYGVARMKDSFVLIMELMEGGDLLDAIGEDVAGTMHWNRFGKSVALDITRGLTALHACNVIHRDIKSKNVLLSGGGHKGAPRAKLADVGVATIATRGYATSAGLIVGTLAWSAPELLLAERCSSKVDIFSLGVVLWEIATGQVPQRGFIQMPEPSARCPQQLIDIMLACLQPDPAQRPTAKEVYDHLLAIPPLEIL